MIYKYILVSLVVFFCIGCGSQGSYNPGRPDIKTSYEVDVASATDYVKRELGDAFVEAYPAKDNANLFVLIEDTGSKYEKIYSLLNYDIRRSVPERELDIVSHYDDRILNVYPLKEKKVLVVSENLYRFSAQENIIIYDYEKNRRIISYSIKFPEYDLGNSVLHFDSKEESFTIGTLTIDIGTIYQKEQESKLYRDTAKNVVVDSVAKLQWQDDASVIAQEYSYEEAQQICQNKEGANWRLPTQQDVLTLKIHVSDTFNDAMFQYSLADRAFSYGEYWLYTSDMDNDFTWTYDPDINTFNLSQHFTHYVRCVANIL